MSTSASWVRNALLHPIAELAQVLGLRVFADRSIQCPRCRRQRADTTRSHWDCVRCRARGDAIDLVSLAHEAAAYAALDAAGRARVRDWFDAHQVEGLSDAPIEAAWVEVDPSTLLVQAGFDDTTARMLAASFPMPVRLPQGARQCRRSV